MWSGRARALILQVGFPTRWSQSIDTMTDKQYVVFGYGSLIFKVIFLSIYEITRFTWFLRKASTSYYRAGWEPDLSTLKTHTWYYLDWSAWIPERLRTTICSKIAWSSWDTRGESTQLADSPSPPMHISRNRTLDEWSRWYIKKIGINFLDKWGCSIDGFLTLTRYWDVFILSTHSRTMILSGASLLTFLYYLLLICSFLYIRHRIYHRLWIWNRGQGVLR